MGGSCTSMGDLKARAPEGTSLGAQNPNEIGEGISKPRPVAAVNGKHCSWTPYPGGTSCRSRGEAGTGNSEFAQSSRIEISEPQCDPLLGTAVLTEHVSPINGERLVCCAIGQLAF